MSDYVVCESSGSFMIQNLEECVNKKLKEGYTLRGPLIFNMAGHSRSSPVALQQMIKTQE